MFYVGFVEVACYRGLIRLPVLFLGFLFLFLVVIP